MSPDVAAGAGPVLEMMCEAPVPNHDRSLVDDGDVFDGRMAVVAHRAVLGGADRRPCRRRAQSVRQRDLDAVHLDRLARLLRAAGRLRRHGHVRRVPDLLDRLDHVAMLLPQAGVRSHALVVGEEQGRAARQRQRRAPRRRRQAPRRHLLANAAHVGVPPDGRVRVRHHDVGAGQVRRRLRCRHRQDGPEGAFGARHRPEPAAGAQHGHPGDDVRRRGAGRQALGLGQVAEDGVQAYQAIRVDRAGRDLPGAGELVEQGAGASGVARLHAGVEQGDERDVGRAQARRLQVGEQGEGARRRRLPAAAGGHQRVVRDDAGGGARAEHGLGRPHLPAGGVRADQGAGDGVVVQQHAVAGVLVQLGEGVGGQRRAARRDQRAEHGHVDGDAPGDHVPEQGQGVGQARRPAERGQDLRVDLHRRRLPDVVHQAQRASRLVEAPVGQERRDQVAEQRIVAVRRDVVRRHQAQELLGAVGAHDPARFRTAGRQGRHELDGDEAGGVGDEVGDQVQGEVRAARLPADAGQQEQDVVGQRPTAPPVPVQGGVDERRPRVQAGARERTEQVEVGADVDAALQGGVQHVRRLGGQVPPAERHHRLEEARVHVQAQVHDALEHDPAVPGRPVLLQRADGQRHRGRAHERVEDGLGRRGRPTAIAGPARRRSTRGNGRAGAAATHQAPDACARAAQDNDERHDALVVRATTTTTAIAHGSGSSRQQRRRRALAAISICRRPQP